jgi:putative oxidoreductase
MTAHNIHNPLKEPILMMSLIRTLMHPDTARPASAGLLLFRVFLGVAFIQHGLMKVPTATTWLGDMLPAWVQAFAAYGELGAGILLILGLFTPLAGVILVAIMIGAVNFHVSQGHPFIGEGHSYEMALAYLMAAILFVLLGAGRYSVDALLFRQRINSSHLDS